MSHSPHARRTSHIVIASAALLWNLVGLALFVQRITMSAAAVSALPPADRAVVDATPAWVLVAFGLAVITGVVGSVGLFLRARWTATAFALSLGALVVQVAGTFAATPAWAAYGAAGLVLPAILLVIAVALWRYAERRA